MKCSQEEKLMHNQNNTYIHTIGFHPNINSLSIENIGQLPSNTPYLLKSKPCPSYLKCVQKNHIASSQLNYLTQYLSYNQVLNVYCINKEESFIGRMRCKNTMHNVVSTKFWQHRTLCGCFTIMITWLTGSCYL